MPFRCEACWNQQESEPPWNEEAHARLCTACAESLSHCDWGDHEWVDVMPRRVLVYDWGGQSLREQTMCEVCVENLYVCDECGNLMESDVARSDEYSEQILCIECDEARGNASGLVHNYSYVPELSFRTADDEPGKGRFFFGMELEASNIAHLGRTAQYLVDTQPFVYLKEDASFDGGFEIVTHPGTLSAWQGGQVIDWSAWERAEGMIGTLRNDPSVGIHIHVSRSAFTNGRGKQSFSHEWRFEQFHYQNPQILQRLAGRGDTYYASWDTYRDRLNLVENVRTKFGGDRYRPINRNNDHTFEMRYFQADERADVMLSHVEMLHAIVEYTRHLTAKDVRNSGLEFVRMFKWAEKQDRYPNFVERVEQIPDLDDLTRKQRVYTYQIKVEVNAVKREQQRRTKLEQNIWRRLGINEYGYRSSHLFTISSWDIFNNTVISSEAMDGYVRSRVSRFMHRYGTDEFPTFSQVSRDIIEIIIQNIVSSRVAQYMIEYAADHVYVADRTNGNTLYDILNEVTGYLSYGDSISDESFDMLGRAYVLAIGWVISQVRSRYNLDVTDEQIIDICSMYGRIRHIVR